VPLPDFLGIGAQRSGTTWLFNQLLAHPEVYVPPQRKEIHFFDWNYDRGRDWYEKWFPLGRESGYRAIGEITPEYLYDEIVPKRIAETLDDPRFVVLLRHPVDRAYSQYCFRIQRMGEGRSFEEFYRDRPDVRERSLYSKCLGRFLNHFPKDRFLVLVYEEVMARPSLAMLEIARFLGIDGDKFDEELLTSRIHSSSRRVYFPLLFSQMRRVGKVLERIELDRMKNTVSKALLELFRKNDSMPRLDPALRQELMLEFRDDVAALKEGWNLDLSAWE